jgi:hypothetical protein
VLAWVFELIVLVWLSLWRKSLTALLAQPQAQPVPPSLTSLQSWRVIAMPLGVLLGLTVIIAALDCGAKKTAGSNGSETTPTVQEVGLTRDQLPLAAQTIAGRWTSYHSGLPDDSAAWSGSCGVTTIPRSDGRLILVTNAHCLNLADLVKTRIVDLRLRRYQLQVFFPGGQSRDVLRMSLPEGEVDLALLEVDGTGLTEGKDFVRLPYSPDTALAPGDDVVAVGTPLGLYEATQTFGHISAIRASDGPESYKIIQADVSLSHGNSGGPLFVKKGARYTWIGVNTWADAGGTGLSFAIHCKAVGDSHFTMFNADPTGAAQAIREHLHVEAAAAK